MSISSLIRDTLAASSITKKLPPLAELYARTAQRSLRPYFIDIYEQMPLACTAISAIASYPSGAYSVTFNGTAGSVTLTQTGGDPSADGGNIWPCCIYDPATDNWQFNVVNTVSGTTITLVNPLDRNITGGTIAFAWDNANSIHLSANGFTALADLVWNTSPVSMVRDRAFFWFNPETFGNFYTTPWVGDPINYSPQWWRVTGGLGTDQFNCNAMQNRTTVAGVLSCLTYRSVAFTPSGAGQGITAPIAMGGAAGTLYITLGQGSNASSTPGLGGNLTVLADGVQIYTANFYGTSKAFYVPFGGCNTLTVTVTALTADAMTIKVGRFAILAHADTVNPLRSANSFMMVGDSWFDKSTRPWFYNRLAALSGKTVIDQGVANMTSAYPLTAGTKATLLDDWLTANPVDTVLIEFSLNDLTAAYSAAEWSYNLLRMANICISYGATPVIFLPNPSNSSSEVGSLLDTYGMALGMPTQNGPYFNQAVQQELGDKTSPFNTSLAFPGYAVLNVTNSEVYLKDGVTNVSIWRALNSAASPATITPA